MKKLTAILISVVLLCLKAKSQTFDTTQYYGKMNYVFEHVYKNLVSTGLLRDYGIEFLNLDNYSGAALHDSNFVALDEWRMLYSSLYSSQINKNANMLYLDTVNRLINRFNYSNMPISFVGLHYNYNKLKDYTLTNNLMTVSNEQLYDVANRPESPYESKELFGIAPIRQAALTGNNQFIFRPELFLGNTGKIISSIAYKSQGAGSYQSVAFNSPFSISYDSSGFYNLDIRIIYTDNSIAYGHTKLVVYASDSSGARYGTFNTPATNETVVATKTYLSQLGQGDITIDLAANNTTGQIRKPLIVVEGFDADGSFNYNPDFLRNLNRDLNINSAITLNNGLDDINQYDLIFLNFLNGTDYIQRNAYLLERVLEIVNQRKTTWNGVRQQNVIIGMSMGGLIARYALRDMELNSQNHETRLFISHDVPHHGANIPVGMQAAVQHLGPWKVINAGGSFPWISWVDMFPTVADALDMFNSPAAKQMLIQRYTLSGQSLTADNGTYTTFMNELNTLGWPQNTRNVSLSNGSCNGSKQFADNNTIFAMSGARPMTYFGSLWRSFVITLAGAPGSPVNSWVTLNSPQLNSWAMLMQFPLALFATSSSIGMDFKIRAVPATGTQEIYRGDIYSKKKILWVINVKNYFIKCHVNSSTGMLPLDNAPGGVYDVEAFGIDAGIITNQLPSFFQGYVTADVLENRFCFIPTVSSLAINNPWQNYTTNICAGIACMRNSSIADYFAPQNNEIHISYTQPATNWLLGIQDPADNCYRLCTSSMSITGPNAVCDNPVTYSINLPQGATAAWNVGIRLTVTNVTSNGSQITVIRNGNAANNITATITAPGNCNAGVSPFSLTKTIRVGAPTANSYVPYITHGGNTSYMSNYCNKLTTICSGSARGGDITNDIIIQPMVISPYNYCAIGYIIDNNATTITWSMVQKSPGTFHGYYNFSGNSFNVGINVNYPTEWVVLRCTRTNECGSAYSDYKFYAENTVCVEYVEERSTATSENVSTGIEIYPNPSTGQFKVNLTGETKNTGIQQIMVMDKMGMVIFNQSYENRQPAQQINLRVPATDIYNIQIFDGKQWLSKKLSMIR